jgi:hypothetical protein
MLIYSMIMMDDKLGIRLSSHAMGSSTVEPRLWDVILEPFGR